MPFINRQNGCYFIAKCGLKVNCGSKRERDLKLKLHRKKCEYCSNEAVPGVVESIEVVNECVWEKFGMVIK
jgi:hypothetical protein